MKDAENARNDYWLDLGPAAEWAGMDAQNTADAEGDASPDGKRHDYFGAEQGTVYSPEGPVKPDSAGQTPDVNSGEVPLEIPPVPPETWPGL